MGVYCIVTVRFITNLKLVIKDMNDDLEVDYNVIFCKPPLH